MIAFFADAVGQAFNCVAIGQILSERGHRCVFLGDRAFSGFYERHGFEECLLDIHVSATGDAHVFTDQVRGGNAVFARPAIEHIEPYIVPYYEAIVDSAIHAQAPLAEALARLRPDFICVDDVVLYPAIWHHGVPWARIISCAETEIGDTEVPPHLSGYGVGERDLWPMFAERMAAALAPTQARFNHFLAEHGLGPLPVGTFMDASPHINFLIYPKAVAFDRARPLPPDRFVYLNGCVRRSAAYRYPDFHADPAWPLVYIGYGSMGSEPDLLARQAAALAGAPVRALFSVPEDFPVPESGSGNIRFDTFVPQPSAIAQADLVAHHGGNNTFNEALYFGKPSVILPFAWDGFDNAQRVRDLGIGLRLGRYDEGIHGLAGAIFRVLADDGMRERVAAIGRKMRADPGPVRAADRILGLLEST